MGCRQEIRFFHLRFLCSCLILAHSASSLDGQGFKNEGNLAENSSSAVTFYTKKPLKIIERQSKIIHWSSSVEGVHSVIITQENDYVSVISNHNETFHPSNTSFLEYSYINGTNMDTVTVEGNINVTATFIGFNKLFVALLDKNNKVLANESLEVDVLLYAKRVAFVYQVCLTIILIIVYINMGANLDLELVKCIIKQPIGPIIGLVCQYGCMPLIAFSLGLLVFPNEPLFRLGLFASGSSPGGGLSNMWTHLLGGSLDLSIMMTFCSTVVALGAVPFWLLTLGKVILSEGNFVIPYSQVVIGIMILILPCFLGIGIQLKFPRVTKVMKVLLTPLSIFNIMFIFSFGVYSNLYLFSYLTWKAVGAGFGQSIIGHVVGFVIAFLCRRSLKEMIAISIETAVQNNGIAFLLLKMSLDKPAGDLAIMLPGCVALFMPLPLLIALLVKVSYQKFIKPQTDSNGEKSLEETTLERELEQRERRSEGVTKRSGERVAKSEYEDLDKLESSERKDRETNTRSDRAENGIDNPALDLKNEYS